MKEKIIEAIENINKMNRTTTRKYNKAIKTAEKQILHTELARLDGKLEAYMEVFNMLIGEQDEMRNV